MKEIQIIVTGEKIDFDLARSLARTIAARDNPDTDLISWFNRIENRHSPSCVHCEIGCRPGWEVYGENHGGRIRFELNNGDYILIFS